jgi:hypothetical protein
VNNSRKVATLSDEKNRSVRVSSGIQLTLVALRVSVVNTSDASWPTDDLERDSVGGRCDSSTLFINDRRANLNRWAVVVRVGCNCNKVCAA